jgi:thiol-disulfide isomerase/thioredoxin
MAAWRGHRGGLILVSAAVMAVAATVAGVLWPGSGAARPAVGAAVPFSLPAVRRGEPPASLALHPGMPTVLYFFAAWCDPCHTEVPLLAGLARREAGQLVVTGVDVRDNRDLAVQLLDQSGARFAAGYDPDNAVSDAWKVTDLPVTVFIAADGRVVTDHRGQLPAGQLDRLAAHLLATGISPSHRQS